MSSDHPTAFNLGKTLGSMDQHLKSIDERLEKGDKTMKELKDSVDKSVEQIRSIDKEVSVHKEKPHLFHITEEEGRMARLKRHAPEIGTAGGVGGLVVGIIMFAIKVGWI